MAWTKGAITLGQQLIMTGVKRGTRGMNRTRGEIPGLSPRVPRFTRRVEAKPH